MPDWEFIEDAASPAVDDTELPTGAPRARRWWLKAATSTVGAVAVLTAVLLRTSADRSPSAAPSPPAPSQSAAPHRSSSAPTPAQIVLNIVDLKRLRQFIRPDGAIHTCPDVRPGSVPQRRAAAVLQHNLVGYRVTGTARVLNEFAELCMLVLRASNGHGTTLALRIIPPSPGQHRDPGFATVQTGFAPHLGDSIQYADSVSRDGWGITVGAVGPVRDSPAASALVRIVQDEDLRW